MKVRDRVKYSHRFLRSIGADISVANAEGTLTDIVREVKRGLFYVKVLWDGETEPTGCLSSNLCIIRQGQLIDPTE